MTMCFYSQQEAGAIHERDLDCVGVGSAVWWELKVRAVRQMLSVASPLVSFCSTQGSRAEELYYPSPCHHEPFDC